jgi:WD40 repeat protein
MRMAPKIKLHLSLFWAVVLLMLFGCSTMFKSPEGIEADKVELEISRMNYFGASGVAFTPDARRVAIGTRDMIWIVDTETSETTARISHLAEARFGGNKSLQFIDNERLAIGADGVIMIWDLKEGLVTHRLRLTSGMLSPKAIVWSEAAQMLAFSTGAAGNPVKIVQINKNGFDSVREVPGFEGVPSDLEFSRDGQYLAAAGDSKNVSIRKVANGELAGKLPTEGFVTELELFGERQLLVAGADIVFWTFMGDEELTEIDNPTLQGQYSKQVTTRVAGRIALGIIWPLLFLGGAVPSDYEDVHYSLVSGVNVSPQVWCGRSTTISPDGKWLVDVFPGITKEVIRVYDVKTGNVARKLNPRGDYSCAAKFSPNGKQFLVTTEKVARLYETHTWTYTDFKLQ